MTGLTDLCFIACTFLGPSRKRGPPKGYIDAIEARLHQTEALIGILLSSKDSRAKTLLADLSEVGIIVCALHPVHIPVAPSVVPTMNSIIFFCAYLPFGLPTVFSTGFSCEGNYQPC